MIQNTPFYEISSTSDSYGTGDFMKRMQQLPVPSGMDR